ncbi:DedA family protein [Paramicrobacterium agarici]|uniref:DedA family protein n=1 Tax=Paramicrobacterium agarici TaxID=630514 RepID=UPI0011549EF7|nr:DedA family protein [Microbacterium agarici]TQO24296.1 membrane protein DedA with SNARE-associated domain [Microbacterium agarici]
MNEILDGILDAVQSVDPVLRTILAGIAIMLETSILVGLVVPGDTIVIVAGTGIESPVQFVAMYCVVVVGALAGESIGFALGRYFGDRIRRSRFGTRIGEHNWQRAERYLERRGGIAVFLSRFLPVLHSLIPVTVGMSTMRYRRFLAWTVPACLIWTGAYVSVGSAAAETYRELSERLHFAGYVFVGIIAIFLLIAWAVKKVLHRIEKRHMARANEELERSNRSQTDNMTGLTDAPNRDESA